MAGPNFVLDKGYVAAGAINIYRAVEIAPTAETVTQCNAVNDRVLGISQDEISAADATNGRVANIRLLGISRCIAGAAIAAAGALVTIDASGRVVTSPTAVGTVYAVVGVVLQTAAAAGDHVDVLLTPGAINNTAVS
jgi:hypothetical protein